MTGSNSSGVNNCFSPLGKNDDDATKQSPASIEFSLHIANVQRITSVEHRRLERRSGRFDPAVLEKVRTAIAWMLELETASG
jgi:hypothetical protein